MRTIPAIQTGDKVQSIYVLDVAMKTKKYEPKNIERIARLIPQNLVFVLHFEGEIQLAVFCEKLFATDWLSESRAVIPLAGLNFDEVWENIIKRTGGGEWNGSLILSLGIRPLRLRFLLA